MKRPTCPKCGKKMIKFTRKDGVIRWTCRETTGDKAYCYTTTDPEARYVRGQDGRRKGKTPIFKRTLGRSTRRVIVTAAQNATPVHGKFLKAIETACNYLNAEPLVVPLRYKNPTSRWTESQDNEEVWADEVQPYLCNQRKRLNRHLVLLADVKTQPTAVSPLSGFEAITEGESGILAHTKLQLRCVPTPQSRYPKLLTTTGAVTVPNYTDSKAGKLGEFHHCLGAALVEIDGKKFHLRQINADKVTGEFYDLDKAYHPEHGVTNAGPALALVMGDTHVDFIDKRVKQATFGAQGIVATLKPQYLVWHDLLDGYAVNPHRANDPFTGIAKRQGDAQFIEQEVRRAAAFVQKHTPTGRRSVIVPSNHNDFLRRWVLNTDWRGDPDNAKFYLETALAMAKGTKLTERGAEYPDPFVYWMEVLCLGRPNIRCLNTDESLMLARVEIGMHGDRGPNGSRGSIRNLRRIGVKSIIGHSHTPGIDEGCYQTGTSTPLRLEYNQGASSWLNTHCVLYANGKRSLINIIDGDWRI